MAKVIISCQYIATFACVLALFSFIFYLTAFFKRLDDFVDRDDSNSVTIAVIQYMCGILLIPLLLYFLYATYSLLDALAVLLDKHVRTSLTEFNIEACMVASATTLLVMAVPFQERVRDVSPDTIYNSLIFVCVGAALLIYAFAAFHRWISKDLSKFKLRQKSLENDKEAITSVLRLQLVDLTPCIVAHCPEKPSLIGTHGVVVGHGVDSSGLVTVKLNGLEYKMQEYQLVPDIPPEKQEEKTTNAELRVAQLEHNLEKMETKQLRRLSIFIISAQLFTGVLVAVIVALVRFENAFGTSLYDDIIERGFEQLDDPDDPSDVNCNNLDSLTDAQRKECTSVQRLLCSFWLSCTNNASISLNPKHCFSSTTQCIVPPAPEGGELSNSDLLLLISISSLFIGFFGTLLTTLFKLGRRRRQIPLRALLASSLMGAFIAAVLAAFMVHALTSGRNPSARCSALDIDEATSGVQRLSMDCVTTSGVSFIVDDIFTESKQLIVGSVMLSLIFLAESTLRFSLAVRHLNPNKFAAFQAAICFAFTAFVVGVWMLLKFGDEQDWFKRADEWSIFITMLGFQLAEEFDISPILFNQTEALGDQDRIVQDLLLNWIGVYMVGGVVFAAQLLGVYFATLGRWLHPYAWMNWVKAILYLNSGVCAYFAFAIYVCIYVVNIKYNILAFFLMPATLQYFFAILFAMQSDVWPVTKNKGYLELIFSVLQHVSPLVLASLFMIGLAMEWTNDGTSGILVMILSGIALSGMISLTLLFALNEFIVWITDVLNLAWIKFFWTPEIDDANADEDA